MKNKKTTTQKYITEAAKQAAENATKGTTVKNSNFYGVHFDEGALEAVSLIAEGLIKNAEGLASLASVLKASNVNIECLLKVNGVEK